MGKLLISDIFSTSKSKFISHLDVVVKIVKVLFGILWD